MSAFFKLSIFFILLFNFNFTFGLNENVLSTANAYDCPPEMTEGCVGSQPPPPTIHTIIDNEAGLLGGSGGTGTTGGNNGGASGGTTIVIIKPPEDPKKKECEKKAKRYLDGLNSNAESVWYFTNIACTALKIDRVMMACLTASTWALKDAKEKNDKKYQERLKQC